MKYMGLRCDVVTKDEIVYLLFYDIDRLVTQTDIDWIDDVCQEEEISYILYRTKNGCHFIGLTPVKNIKRAVVFEMFKDKFHSYYGGIVIRLSRKKDEIQELITKNTTYGKVIPNVHNLYATRFGYEKMPFQLATAEYRLVFEKYETDKT